MKADVFYAFIRCRATNLHLVQLKVQTLAVIKAPTIELTNFPELICDCAFYTSVWLTVVDFEIGYGNNLDQHNAL